VVERMWLAVDLPEAMEPVRPRMSMMVYKSCGSWI
jgi:hypothetical protein